ncbi:hypothetical protein IW261DRAFT_1524219 [Armillaria novae-zelandiae]|uniref:Secreted protein n=1 Tax=Armillaria novae-zelandiae TaxID=153914 RepID=A0AA39T4W0_9AGAR|nr:hypothetical protein IW261DRAFT_1524219 [Armillaria novae-zelandiae]
MKMACWGLILLILSDILDSSRLATGPFPTILLGTGAPTSARVHIPCQSPIHGPFDKNTPGSDPIVQSKLAPSFPSEKNKPLTDINTLCSARIILPVIVFLPCERMWVWF